MGHILALKSVSGINPIGFGKVFEAGEVFEDVREGDTVGIECDDGLYGALIAPSVDSSEGLSGGDDAVGGDTKVLDYGVFETVIVMPFHIASLTNR